MLWGLRRGRVAKQTRRVGVKGLDWSHELASPQSIAHALSGHKHEYQRVFDSHPGLFFIRDLSPPSHPSSTNSILSVPKGPRRPLLLDHHILRRARYYPSVSETLHHACPTDYTGSSDQELATYTYKPFSPIVSLSCSHFPCDRSQCCVMPFTHRCSAFQPSEERRSPYMCSHPGRTLL